MREIDDDDDNDHRPKTKGKDNNIACNCLYIN